MSSKFTVYNASAGSGKTYTIVKEYLKIVLSSPSPFKYQQILAITFTNKAAAEMKERIFNQLREFGNLNPNDKPSDLLIDLEKELQLDRKLLIERAKNVSSQILHDYSKFNISTIDKFTHKLIRTFSFDLGLPVNFDVEMNVKNILEDAVDVLISKIGNQKDLTNALVNFSIRNLKDGKTWDIAYALKDISSELFKEEAVEEIEELKKHSISDFVTLAKTLRELEKEAIADFKKLGSNALDLIYASDLEDENFSRGGVPKYFARCKEGLFGENNASKSVSTQFEKEQLYTKTNAKKPFAQTIDSIFRDLKDYFDSTMQWAEERGPLVTLIRLILKNIDSVTVLNEIEKELSEIKRNNNVLFNSEFNKRISDEIKNQPVPYIYERIGEKFQYFFIDEFQDTSVLQWQNLIPLIENSMANGGDCVIVGDGKQAIYRWRGGKAEQFIDLSQKKVEFPFEITPATLDKNYRSYSHIINFSNDFFKHTSSSFSNESYRDMYIDGNNQKINNKVGGYIEIDIFEKNDAEDLNDQNNSRTENIIRDLTDEGYSLSDICILTRNNKEGISVSNYLIDNGIDVVSKESLLIKNNKNVDFCIQSLKLINFNDDFDARLKVIEYLISNGSIEINEDETHNVYSEFVKLSTEKFYGRLKKYGINFDVNSFLKLPLYDAIEEFIRTFNLAENAGTEIQFFLDFVLEFSSRNNTGINSFLEHWEEKSGKLSLVIPEGLNAVQVMTIHKSKGLEFPIVIFPYANWNTNDRNPKTWIELENHEENFNGIKNALVGINKDLKTTKGGDEIYKTHENEVMLDNLNLLYVALTRPVQRLYVITYKDSRKKLSKYFIDYLNHKSEYIKENMKVDGDKYCFGEKVFIPTEYNNANKKYELKNLESYKWINRVRMSLEAPKYWNIGEITESEYGNLIHSILAEINYADEKEDVLNKLVLDGNLPTDMYDKINNLIDNIILNPNLKQYFSEEYEVKNEQDIILTDKTILRPDRVVIKNNNAVVIDYKTGSRIEKHDEQINTYAKALESIGYTVDKKLLVYLKDTVEVVEIG